jgi:hypothetical protein
MRATFVLLVFSIIASAFGMLPAHAAATPKPKRIIVPVPTVPLHTEFVVEVNKLGQIVRVISGKSSKDLTYNAQTYGNVLQMWIRKADGTGEVGVYRVTYDYTPKTHKISRSVTLLRAGGNWGDQEGAVNQMLAADRKSAQKENTGQTQGTPPPVNLPSLDSITGSPKPHASPHR